MAWFTVLNTCTVVTVFFCSITHVPNPWFFYAILLYDSAAKTNLEKIEKVHRRKSRVSFFKKKHGSLTKTPMKKCALTVSELHFAEYLKICIYIYASIPRISFCCTHYQKTTSRFSEPKRKDCYNQSTAEESLEKIFQVSFPKAYIWLRSWRLLLWWAFACRSVFFFVEQQMNFLYAKTTTSLISSIYIRMSVCFIGSGHS